MYFIYTTNPKIKPTASILTITLVVPAAGIILLAIVLLILGNLLSYFSAINLALSVSGNTIFLPPFFCIISFVSLVLPYIPHRGATEWGRSRWGSCIPTQNKITLNKNLIYAPWECLEYVTLHEISHLIEANHSKNFYNIIESVRPDWKNRKKILNEF